MLLRDSFSTYIFFWYLVRKMLAVLIYYISTIRSRACQLGNQCPFFLHPTSYLGKRNSPNIKILTRPNILQI